MYKIEELRMDTKMRKNKIDKVIKNLKAKGTTRLF